MGTPDFSKKKAATRLKILLKGLRGVAARIQIVFQGLNYGREILYAED
jgi:hypothetical protein